MRRSSKRSRPVRPSRRPERPRRSHPGAPSRRWWRSPAPWALVLAGALLPGCDLGSDPAPSHPVLTRGEFIEVYTALRDAKLDLDRADSVPEGRFQELRDSILTAHGVSEAELFAFVNAHPRMEYQIELWDSINRRLKRPLRVPSVQDGEGVVPDSAGRLKPPPRPGAIERQEPIRR